MTKRHDSCFGSFQTSGETATILALFFPYLSKCHKNSALSLQPLTFSFKQLHSRTSSACVYAENSKILFIQDVCVREVNMAPPVLMTAQPPPEATLQRRRENA